MSTKLCDRGKGAMTAVSFLCVVNGQLLCLANSVVCFAVLGTLGWNIPAYTLTEMVNKQLSQVYQ